MRMMPALLALLGCPSDPPIDPGPDSAPPDTTVEGGAPPYDAHDLHLCDLTSSAHQVVSVAPGAATGVLGRAVLEVTLSEAGHVQARCVSDDEPLDVHWAESSAAGLSHALALGGLDPRADHTCQVTAVCPHTTSSPVEVALPWPEPLLSAVSTPSVDTHPELEMTGAWTLASWYSPRALGTRLILLDPLGEVRWEHGLGDIGIDLAARYVDGRVLYGGGGFTGTPAVGLVDLAGESLYDGPPWDLAWDHHAELRPDGTILALAAESTQSGPQLHDGFQLRQWDPETDELVWEWHSIDAVEAGELSIDYAHSNWATLTDDDTTALVSLCDFQQILRIDVASGAVLDRLGVGGDYALVDHDGTPLTDDDLPQCQHGVDVVGDTWWMMDNGRDREESRAVALLVDPATGTATRTWSWTREGWYSDILGDADWLSEDRVLVVNGTGRTLGSRPWIAEVDVPSGEVVWEATFRSSDWIYRGQRIDGCALFASERWCPSVVDRLRGGPVLD